MSLKRLAAALAIGAAALFSVAPTTVNAQSAALKSGTTVVDNCASWSTGNLVKDSGVQCSGGNVTVTGGGNSALLTPNIYGMDGPGILNNTSAKQFYFTKSVATTGQDSGDFECYRHANYVNADLDPAKRGWVNPCMMVYTVAEAGGKQRFEWPFLSRLDNYSNIADDTENTAGYIQARKFGTAPTFSFVTEIYDQTPNPVAGSVTDEHDMSAKGLDNNNARVLLDMFARNPWDTTPTEVAWGIRLNTDAVTKIKNGITFTAGSRFINGINMAAATIDSAAIVLGDGHAICFDSTCLRKKFFSAGVTYQSVPVAGVATNLFSWADNGQFSAKYLNSSNGIYFGGLTSSYPFLRQGLNATVEVRDATDAGGGNLRASNYILPSGGKICFDDYTCAYTFSLSGSNTIVTAANITTLGSVTAGGNVAVPTNGKVCLNGLSPCSIYATYDGTNLLFSNAGSSKALVNMSTGQIVSASGYTAAGLLPGVTCSGINAATVTVNGGIVTHC